MNFLIYSIFFLVHIIGIIMAINAILNVQSPQGTVTWAICLVIFPYITIPIYFILGRNKFYGYTQNKKIAFKKIDKFLSLVQKKIFSENSPRLTKKIKELQNTLNELNGISFTNNNYAKILIDGDETFREIFSEIKKAKKYILVQFFIIRNDIIGNELKNLLIEKARENVNIFVLYDEMGCHKLPEKYLDDLTENRINICPFHTTKGKYNILQINFRNHRKIVIVDGEVSFIGGLNVGDEYLGRIKKYGNWRDTFVKLKGPSVLCSQISFLKDWFWSNDELINLSWELEKTIKKENSEIGNQKVLIIPSGPENEINCLNLVCIELINNAKDKIWFASPYFVPDETILTALRLAALRGVKIKIIIPHYSDNILVHLSSFSFYKDLNIKNIQVYRYKRGFMHQKVILVDDNIASIGTANLDNRSLRLNFEISAIINDKTTSEIIEKMLIKDIENSYEVDLANSYKNLSYLFKFVTNFVRLFSPIL